MRLPNPVLALTAVVCLLGAGLLVGSGGCGGGGTTMTPPPPPPPPSSPFGQAIQHVVIIIQENRTPDNLFHGLPGADIANAGVDSSGRSVPLKPVNLSAPWDIDHSHAGFVTEFNNGALNGFDKAHFNSCHATACSPTAFGYVPPSQ